ncbi:MULTISPECIES: M20/M25/M40 family metallo-hydrolase [unclassified Streptomyces]|uniref:M20/M25/M40 family metallo-hydrolase n=1 Tax=unclassified Streptomyces TaxID=2593676 RepID=UPI002024E58A|nr:MULTISPECIES: M20/M25/M40 family metallo-hydrolase [unclassified Streptomyces]MCX4549405.1 M20/M25/M40 family metallo-hydrolase [Streptomyces sp. NBC_01500]
MSTARRSAVAALAAAALAGPLLPTPTATARPAPATSGPAHPGTDHAKEAAQLSRELVRMSSAEDAYRHLRKLQSIADANHSTRAAGTPGHEASAQYVHDTLRKAGYRVSYQTFGITYIETRAEKLSVVTPGAPARKATVSAMSYTKSTPVGGIEAALAAVPLDATTGCEAADYAAGAFTGKIALIRRGGCTFTVKQAAAAGAGAVAALIYNDTGGVLSGTLGSAAGAKIPTGGLSGADGTALAADAAKGATVSLEIRQLQEPRTTRNVVAETPGGDPAHTVMLGAHLDSVTAGPGINDDGSGSAGLIEVAQQLARTHRPLADKVRFAWWSGEELGLLGSGAYVKGLTAPQKKQIALYLNFDMIASPNYAQLVYDSTAPAPTGTAPAPVPAGTDRLTKGITSFLDRRHVPHEATAFDGRSDYGPFMAAGIPSGGSYTGAEELKTAAQAEKFGGTAGVALDACYHAACDTLKNIDMTAFDLNIDVIADAVGTYAYTAGPSARP